MVTPVTTAGGGIYREGDDDEGDYSPGNIAKTTGLRWAHYCCTVGVVLSRASFEALYRRLDSTLFKEVQFL